MLLLEPMQIGNLDLKNRMAMPAMHHAYTPDGFVNERLIAYYRTRAEGGAALITVGGCTIDDFGGGAGFIGLNDDKYLPGLQQLAAAVKGGNAAVAAQLYHAGRYAFSIMTGKQAIAPSPIASRLTREEPREMTLEDIEKVMESFAAAAGRARIAGFDAVEIIASAGYLICQFLSPLTNQRTDEYGGTFENRCRFGVEVVKRIRRETGDDFTLLVRLSGHDFMPGGSTNQEAALFARKLEEAGVHGINVTGGWHETRVPQTTGDLPRGGFAYLAQGIKEAVDVPVIASNRINDPEVAEAILRNGQADMINFGRPLLADPQLPHKVKAGLPGSIRKCIACNQGCMDMVFSARAVHCTVNPVAGRESEVQVTPAATPRRVLVVGGGPAGMEAACTAAARGHHVTLWEKDAKLGGQLHYAASAPGKQEFLSLLDYYQEELKARGVMVALLQEATVEKITEFNPEAVILATGSLPLEPPFPVNRAWGVISAREALAQKVPLGKNVVVVGGGSVGCEAALAVAQIGTINGENLKFLMENDAESLETLKALLNRGIKNVTIVEQFKGLGKDLGITTRWVVLKHIRRMGIKAKDQSRVVEVNEKGVVVEKDGNAAVIPADAVILAVGARSVNLLEVPLRDQVKELHVIGDAAEPRKITEAIQEGFEIARLL